ncbi:uncharacterized protein V1516DRAFT_675421 [Lipomyces oligophaga]|uniref:uncharacterized protein n=1 Tax=Lipomyces oligophaga TaxID=45792 RepID=UPI0034CEF83D
MSFDLGEEFSASIAPSAISNLTQQAVSQQQQRQNLHLQQQQQSQVPQIQTQSSGHHQQQQQQPQQQQPSVVSLAGILGPPGLRGQSPVSAQPHHHHHHHHLLDPSSSLLQATGSSSSSSSSQKQNVDLDQDRMRMCNRCRRAKPLHEFLSAGKILKRCARCRELSSQLKKEKRRHDMLKAAEARAMVPDPPSYENYYIFTRDLRKDLIRYPPPANMFAVASGPGVLSTGYTRHDLETATTVSASSSADSSSVMDSKLSVVNAHAAAQLSSPTYAHQTNTEFLLGSRLSLPALGPVGEQLDRHADNVEEPKDLFAALIDAVYDATGYLFIRRNNKRNEVLRTFKVYYICSRSKEKANMPHSDAPTKRTHRRELFECGGSLLMRADFNRRNIQIHIKHGCIHIPAERRPFKNGNERSVMTASYNQTPHPQWSVLKSVFSYLSSPVNETNRPLQDYVIEQLAGTKYIEELGEVVGRLNSDISNTNLLGPSNGTNPSSDQIDE